MSPPAELRNPGDGYVNPPLTASGASIASQAANSRLQARFSGVGTTSPMQVRITSPALDLHVHGGGHEVGTRRPPVRAPDGSAATSRGRARAASLHIELSVTASQAGGVATTGLPPSLPPGGGQGWSCPPLPGVADAWARRKGASRGSFSTHVMSGARWGVDMSTGVHPAAPGGSGPGSFGEAEAGPVFGRGLGDLAGFA